MRIGVLNNLRAGRNLGRVSEVLGVLREHPDVVHLETSTSAMVPEALEDLAKRDVELLVVSGGDGTVHRVLTELLASPARSWLPLVAPIRTGRTNMTALSLGARRDAVRGLAEVIAAARAGTLAERTVELPVIRADFGGVEGTSYGMFFGAGMLHRAVQLTTRHLPSGRAQGLLGAGLVTGSLLARAAAGRLKGVLTPDKIQIALDGEELRPEEFVLVMCTTLERLFFGMRPFWGTAPQPLRVTAIAARARRLRWACPGLLRGRPPAFATPAAGFTSRNVARAALRLDCGVTVDGELVAPEPDRVVQLRAEDRLRFVRA